MWERFELFWTAFEKFALFFGFIGTLVALVMVTMVYRTVTAMPMELTVPPTPTPLPTPPIREMIDIMLDGFDKIQGAVSTGTVPINHTVPIVLEVRIHPDQTKLEFVGKNEIKTDDIAIKFPDDVGWLVGNAALIEFTEGEALRVKMDVQEQVRFNVPIRTDASAHVPSGVDLEPEIDALQAISDTWGSGTTAAPENVSSPP